MDFTNLISNVISAHRDDGTGEKRIVAFKGIGPAQATLIASHSKALSKDAGYMSADGRLDLLALNASKHLLLAKALQADGTAIALYEELLLLAPSLPLIGAEVTVVQNNLFRSGHAPSILDEDQASQLANLYASDALAEGESELYAVAKGMYAEIERLDDGGFVVTHINPHTDEDIAVKNLFDRASLPENSTPAFAPCEPTEAAVEKIALNLLGDGIEGVTVGLSTQAHSKTKELVETLAGALQSLGIPFGVSWSNPYEIEAEEEVSPDLEAVLQKHWSRDGRPAEFRMLKFYKNPAIDKELVEVSQGVICSQAVAQAEAALEGRPCKSIFLTSSTGAGKSLLFQLPATYLARKHGALTVVISPLISLMDDQVKHLHRQGIKEATCLNSDASQQERSRRIEALLSGEYSIVYMSPEMFLHSCQVSELLEKRKVAMLVVDEVHTVATWGKEFRSDYWFLGDRLRKLKKSGHSFPVMCFTATGVLGGDDDTVYQTISELGIENPLVYFGEVKRDNIAFDIKVRDRGECSGGLEETKLQLAGEKIAEYIEEGHKALVYCPFRKHASRIQEKAQNGGFGIPKGKVWKYTGGMEGEQKAIAAKKFAAEDGGAVLACTKAYGMGVDIKDVDRVYHFAPTGGLADYVQEIGRAGRKEGAQAVASVDFFENDVRYIKTLAYSNEISVKQLKQLMGKLYETYRENGKERSMLVSPESFSYLFGEGEDGSEQFRRAMMILQDDFHRKHGYPMLVVKPQASFTKSFVNVPDASKDSFLERYGQYASPVAQPKPRITGGRGKSGAVVTRNSGEIYKVDMAELWKQEMPERTFPMVKKAFFDNVLFEVDGPAVSPRQKLTIKFDAPFSDTLDRYKELLECVDSALMGFKAKGKAFTKREFESVFMGFAGDEFERRDALSLVFEFFVSRDTYRSENSKPSDPVACVFHRKDIGVDRYEHMYMITRPTYVSVVGALMKEAAACSPAEGDEHCFTTYLPAGPKSRGSSALRFASLVQLLGLGSYEVTGGEDPQVYVRINEPLELKDCSEDSRYYNGVLAELKARKKRGAQIIEAFFKSELSDEERWEVIEDYFLGNLDVVKYTLGIEDGSL